MARQLPNIITLLRLVLSFLTIACILNERGQVLAPLVLSLIIFATDYIDGRIARRAGSATYFGAVFDIVVDLFYIAATYAILVYLNIAPLWFLAVILLKFTEFIVTSHMLKRHSNGKSMFVFDLIGRLVSLLFYCAPLSIFLSYNLSLPIYHLVVGVILYVISVIAIVSTLYRAWRCLTAERLDKKMSTFSQRKN